MKREVSVSVFAVLIIAAAILTVYYLNVGPTGFAVFDQNSQTAFDEGTYSNVLYNGSAVVLDANQTSGTYESKIFYAGNFSNTWNSLVWQGNGVTFEVRSCAVSDCSDTNFTTASDLSNLSLSGQYFQYKASFDSSSTLESVSIDYTAEESTSVTITQPTGNLDSPTGVPLTFTKTGVNLTCWYDVHLPNGAEIIANTTISNCATSTTIDLPSDGDYILNLYANGSFGFASASSPFTVEAPSDDNNEPAEELEQAPPQPTPELTLEAIETVKINPSNSQDLDLVVKNTGQFSVSQCNLRSVVGDFASWLSFSDTNVSLTPGEEKSFDISVIVPTDASEGEYEFFLNLRCSGYQKNSEFSIQVENKKLDLNITNVERTRDDRVRVDYALIELAGEDQSVDIVFSILDASGFDVANVSQNSNVSASETGEFSVNIPVNESLEGNLTLSAALNSQTYSSTVLEPITLGAPIGGFAIFGGNGGAGSIIVLVVIVVVLGAVFFVARRLRQSRKFFGSNPDN